jgi:hypothetical protein
MQNYGWGLFIVLCREIECPRMAVLTRPLRTNPGPVHRSLGSLTRTINPCETLSTIFGNPRPI